MQRQRHINMLRLILLVSITALLKGGTVQGVVLEQLTGRPLSRTIVRLDPIPGGTGTLGKPVSMRTGVRGQFVMYGVASGVYRLTTIREGFFPASYGQRVPSGRGKPIAVETDSKLFVELRMRHKGAITGRVQDENGVGAPGVNVLAYRARLPLRSAGTAKSDDRGIYRIEGLEPGKYWVRSGPHTLEDGSGWFPTFGFQGREVRNARVSVVTLDSDTGDGDVQPEPGTLYEFKGTLSCELSGPIQVTLTSETVQRTFNSTCNGGFQFEALSTGNYEVFATMQGGNASAFAEFFLSGNLAMNLSLARPPDVDIEVYPAAGAGPLKIPVKLTGRRQNLSQTGGMMEIAATRVRLDPGFWELRATAPSGYYVKSIDTPRMNRRGRRNLETATDWFELFIDVGRDALIRVVVSDQVTSVSGRAIVDGKGSAGVPVFLWPNADAVRRSVGGALETITDGDGAYRFENLPPGEYRVLASFDVSEMDGEMAEVSRAPVVNCEAGRPQVLDVPVWAAPF